MRPLVGDDAVAGRSRRASLTDNAPVPHAASYQPPQMTCFLADERSMDASLSGSRSNSSRTCEHLKRSNFGVESVESMISSSGSQDSDDLEGCLSTARNAWKQNIMETSPRSREGCGRNSTSPSPKSSADISRDISPAKPRCRRSPRLRNPLPATPTLLESPMLGSTPSTPVSRRNSETDFSIDDNASQAILSSEEDDGYATKQQIDSTSSSSQLVMPSIRMPSRRPFTEKGRSLGRLKILIAGDSGIGKTSLIKAIVQTCEDIVHVDPLVSPSVQLPEYSKKSNKSILKNRHPHAHSTSNITEIYASTKAYPHWWSDLDESKVLRRRRSSIEPVLERNICFVDTPGFGNGTSSMENIMPVVQYVESQVERFAPGSGMSDGELINILSGSGGSQVDVVLYVIRHRIKPIDLEYLRRLCALTNVIPLIAQADALTPDQIQMLKLNILRELHAAGIRPFLFGASIEEASTSGSTNAPFAVSTVAGSDQENMDASLLMSSEYVQPLIPTELTDLVEKIFDTDNISWLRHLAAKKCAQWRKGSPSSSNLSRGIVRCLSLQSSGAAFGSNSHQVLTPPIGATSSYALARVADHTQREERLAQVRLSKWATDLQRSLQNERLRFEALARGERAVWLTERLGECVQDGTLVPVTATKSRANSPTSGSLVKHGHLSRRTTAGLSLDPSDPLGLVHLNTEVKRKTWAALQIVGSFGVIGGLAYWFAKNWHTDNENLTWGVDWSRLIMDW